MITANQEKYDAEERRLVLESEYRDPQGAPDSNLAWVSVPNGLKRVGGWIPSEFVRKGRPCNFELLQRPVESLPDDLKLVLLAALHDGLVIRRKKLIRSQPKQLLHRAATDLLKQLKAQTPFDHLKDELCGVDHRGKRTLTRWLCDREFVVTMENTLEELASGEFKLPEDSSGTPTRPDEILPDRRFRLSGHEFFCDGRMGDLLRIYLEKDRHLTDEKVGEILSPDAPLQDGSVRALRSDLVKFLEERFEPCPRRNTQETTDGTGFFLTYTIERKKAYRLRLGGIGPKKSLTDVS